MSLFTMFFWVQNFINMQRLILIKCFEKNFILNVSLNKYVSNFDQLVLIKIFKKLSWSLFLKYFLFLFLFNKTWLEWKFIYDILNFDYNHC
jgi:hypothetical protein